ncbi:hypothetical protein NDU88_004211 [Pleurodeles waltl]|uniref:Uncharacterized protein n=1 Tax=Pleurodeles waltl TaxID=8319 RepID=A0AAV7RKV6_PLEWA|nr:hypothetical protein NDU88_004211 [Pleurodeles waltl]
MHAHRAPTVSVAAEGCIPAGARLGPVPAPLRLGKYLSDRREPGSKKKVRSTRSASAGGGSRRVGPKCLVALRDSPALCIALFLPAILCHKLLSFIGRSSLVRVHAAVCYLPSASCAKVCDIRHV